MGMDITKLIVVSSTADPPGIDTTPVVKYPITKRLNVSNVSPN